MKKLSILLILIMALANAYFVSVKVDGARFRAGPGKNQKIRWDMEKGYPLYVIGQQGSWYKVKDYLGYIGWVHKITVSHAKSAIISKPKINLRQGPGINYRKIGKGYRGQIFWISRKTRNWARLIDKNTNKVYWIHRSLVWGV